jgi:hypothetical protein
MQSFRLQSSMNTFRVGSSSALTPKDVLKKNPRAAFRATIFSSQ